MGSLFAFALAAIAYLAPELPPQHRLADAIAVAAEASPIFPGEDGRRTVALLAVTAWEESRLDPYAVGDSGRSCGYFGIWVGHSSAKCLNAQESVEAITVVARDMLRDSLIACRSYPENERLGVYVGGHCSRGLKLSRWRWWMMTRLLKAVREEGSPS